MPQVRECTTDALSSAEREVLRAMLGAAYDGDFADEDWAHALGGVHFMVHEGEAIVAHACVVPRALEIRRAGSPPRPFPTGFVEAVATVHGRRGQGLGTAVMRAATVLVRERYALGSLCTGSTSFYARLGWERWRGLTFVRDDAGWSRTPEEDDTIMVLRTPSTGPLELTEDIACEWRPGDVW